LNEFCKAQADIAELLVLCFILLTLDSAVTERKIACKSATTRCLMTSLRTCLHRSHRSIHHENLKLTSVYFSGLDSWS